MSGAVLAHLPLLTVPQRLMRDFRRLKADPPQGVDASPNPDNIMQWSAVILGPEDTSWDGGSPRFRPLLHPPLRA